MIYFGTHLCYSLCHNIFDGSLYEVDSIMKNFKDAQKRTHILSYPLSAGRWGGIWEAQRAYTFTAKNNQQTDVVLTKKFDNWDYSNSGIEQRMPWIADARLTTSENAYSNWWGTITGRY